MAKKPRRPKPKRRKTIRWKLRERAAREALEKSGAFWRSEIQDRERVRP